MLLKPEHYGTDKPPLLIECKEERKRILGSIHDLAQLGKDKTLSEVTARYEPVTSVS